MSTELISGVIGLISGTIIVSVTNYFNHKREEKMRIFNQNLQIYLELSKNLVKSKLNLQDKVAKIDQLNKNNKLTNKNLHQIEDEIRKIILQFYDNLYSYAFLLPEDVFIQLEKVYIDMAEILAWNPNKNIFQKDTSKKIEKTFDEALEAFSKNMNINNKKIEVKNPHFLTNRKRLTDKELETMIAETKK